MDSDQRKKGTLNYQMKVGILKDFQEGSLAKLVKLLNVLNFNPVIPSLEINSPCVGAQRCYT